MIHIEKQSPKKPAVWGYLCYILLLFFFLYLFSSGIEKIAKKAESEQLDILEQAIQRASIQCYAIEGRYPPSLEYLEKHYGISIDRENYYVFYDGWASNIMPDITVLPANPTKEDRLWK